MNVYWDFTPKLPALKAGVVEVKYIHFIIIKQLGKGKGFMGNTFQGINYRECRLFVTGNYET